MVTAQQKFDALPSSQQGAVADLVDQFISKGNEVPGRFRRGLTAGQKSTIEQFQSDLQSGRAGVVTRRAAGVQFQKAPSRFGGVQAGLQATGEAEFEGAVGSGLVPFGQSRTLASQLGGGPSPILPGQTGVPETTKGGQTIKKSFEFEGSTFRQQRDPGFKDIAFGESFRGDPIPEGKISPAGLFDLKLRRGAEKASDIVLEKFPEGRIKSFLQAPSPVQITPSEFVKFGLFAPALATTTEFAGSISQQLAKSPILETKFVSQVTPKGKGRFDIGVVSKTTAEDFEKSFFTISKQQAFQSGEQVMLSVGKGARVSRPSGIGGVSKTEIIDFEIIGGSKSLGQAKGIRNINELFARETEAGTGTFAKSFAQDTSKTIQRSGLNVGVPELESLTLPTTRVSQVGVKGSRGFRLERVGASETEIFGAIKPLPETDFLVFAGQTERPITQISSRGISKRLDFINVRGIIKETKQFEPSFKSASPRDFFQSPSKGGIDTSLKTSTEVIFKDIPQVAKRSVSEQVAGSIGGVKTGIQQQTSGTSFLPSFRSQTQLFSTLKQPKLFEQAPSFQKTFLPTPQSFISPSILKSGSISSSSFLTELKQPLRLKSVSKVDEGLKDFLDVGQRVQQDFLQPQKTKQPQKFNLSSQFKQDQLFRDFGRPQQGFNFFKAPRGRIPLALLPLDSRPKKRKTRLNGKKVKTRIAPSLTGVIIADIGGVTGPLPTEFRNLGILPGQVRLAPKKSKKKSSKKSKNNNFFKALDF